MTRTYYGYYSSPIGILEIVTCEDALLTAMFVEKTYEAVDKPLILKEAIIQFDQYFSGTRKDFDIKYEVQGTDFERRVWKALVEIPYGETVSYKELASSIGNEKASRAVGNANGKNLIGIIIPCHRVVGSDKSLRGYAGRLDRKQWLLEHEKAILEKCN